MKRPAIVKKLPQIAFLAFLLGLFCMLGGVGIMVLRFGPDLHSMSWVANGASFWLMAVMFISIDYCCRAIEELSSRGGKP